MANILTRMAQNALGAAPVVAPVDRPLFAAQHAPLAHALAAKLETEESRDFPQQARTNVPLPAQPRVPELFQSHPPDEAPDAQDHDQRSGNATGPSASTKPGLRSPAQSKGPTLREVIDQIFAARESEAGKRQGEDSVFRAEMNKGVSHISVRANESVPHPVREDRQLAMATPIVAQPKPRMQPSQPPQLGFSGNERPQQGEPHSGSRPAAPAVRVTIGNIEIKAPPQSAPVAQARAPRRAPHMTLSEYLERRRSGRL